MIPNRTRVTFKLCGYSIHLVKEILLKFCTCNIQLQRVDTHSRINFTWFWQLFGILQSNMALGCLIRLRQVSCKCKCLNMWLTHAQYIVSCAHASYAWFVDWHDQPYSFIIWHKKFPTRTTYLSLSLSICMCVCGIMGINYYRIWFFNGSQKAYCPPCDWMIITVNIHPISFSENIGMPESCVLHAIHLCI